MSRLLNVRDQISLARNLIEAASRAVHALDREEADPPCAVLDIASDKLLNVSKALAEVTEHRSANLRSAADRALR